MRLFCSTGSGFLDTEKFAELPYLGMKLGKWPKFQKLHMYALSTRGWSKFRLFLLYRQPFTRYRSIFKIEIFGHETCQVAKVPEVAHIQSFYPSGSKLKLFLLYGQWFPAVGQIFKIAIVEHETWKVAKVPEFAHIPSFYSRGS